MTEPRRTEPHPPLFANMFQLLRDSPGAIRLDSEEALAYWVTVLQQHAAECEFGTNADPISEAPRLFVLGMERSEKMFNEVDFLKDDPSKILEEEWSPVELRAG